MTSSSHIGASATWPSFQTINPTGTAPLLLLCDHASNAVPDEYDGLGLDPETLGRHIAYDIGAKWVTEHLARLLDSPAIFHGASRLLIDPNRTLDDPTSICAISDGAVIPGNRSISGAERARRADRYFHPYHREIDAVLNGFASRSIEPPVVAIHSYNPIYKGVERPWHIGVLWMHENAVARGLIDYFDREPQCTVGDNAPYDARNGHGYTIETHVEPRGLPNALIEIRNDLIATEEGATLWAERLAGALAAVLPRLAAVNEDQVA
ncbi:MAG: N-formylglutamate amidohydrolase [Pseudomonadota bacterium]